MKKKCDWCPAVTEVKNEIESVYHNHHYSHKIQKKVKFVGHFELMGNGLKFPFLCLDCQIKVIRGMSNGGMWE